MADRKLRGNEMNPSSRNQHTDILLSRPSLTWDAWIVETLPDLGQLHVQRIVHLLELCPRDVAQQGPDCAAGGIPTLQVDHVEARFLFEHGVFVEALLGSLVDDGEVGDVRRGREDVGEGFLWGVRTG